MIAQGVPMLCGGDEIGRTQRGNNNAYCQDGEISWYDWNLDRLDRDLLEFTRLVIALRKRHPVLRRRQFFFGRRIRGSEVKDLSWFRPDGREMTEEDWTNAFTRCVGLRLSGEAMNEVDPMGRPLVDDTLLILLNAHHEPLPFVLPAHHRGVRWETLIDTRTPDGRWAQRPLHGGATYALEGRSLAVLRLARPEGRRPPRARAQAQPEPDAADVDSEVTEEIGAPA
jgi:glycogen operon protein